jgi:hypothetical protein
VPPSPAHLNLIARIDRGVREIQQVLQSTTPDLQRLVREAEGLTPQTLPLFQSHAETFHWYLEHYIHTPQALRDAMKSLTHAVQALSAQLDGADREEIFQPLPQLPPEPAELKVEMA